MCVCGGGGGGVTPKTGTHYLILELFVVQSSAEDTRAKCPTYGITENGTTLNIITFANAEGASV